MHGTLDAEEVCNKGDVFIVIDPAVLPGGSHLEAVSAYLEEVRATPRQAGSPGARCPVTAPARSGSGGAATGWRSPARCGAPRRRSDQAQRTSATAGKGILRTDCKAERN